MKALLSIFFCFLTFAFPLFFVHCEQKRRNEPISVSYTNKFKFKELYDNKFIVIEKETYSNDALNLYDELDELNLDDDIYFYKSFTKFLNNNNNSLQILNSIKLHFEYKNGGDLIVLNKKKEGIVVQLNKLFSENTAPYEEVEMQESSDAVKAKLETIEAYDFVIYNDSSYNEKEISGVAVCELPTNLFLATKYLCFSSLQSNINATFIKNKEFERMFELMNIYLQSSDTYLIKETQKYLENMFKKKMKKYNLHYYIFSKTLACNLENSLTENLKDYHKDQKILDQLQMYTDQQISKNNEYLLNHAFNYKKIDGEFIIWRYYNEELKWQIHPKCRTLFFIQSSFSQYEDNLKNVYECSLFSDLKLNDKEYINQLKLARIQGLSSVKDYTVYFYSHIDLLVVLKNYKFYSFFKLPNIVDLVVFNDHHNELSFYYVSANFYEKTFNIYRCSLNSFNIVCDHICMIPKDHNATESNVFIATAQTKDTYAVYLSTPSKIWKIYMNDKNQYKLKIIDIIEDKEESQFFGRINCYAVDVKYSSYVLPSNLKKNQNFYDKSNSSSNYKNDANVNSVLDRTHGCSYFKHFRNSKNSLLINYVETIHLVQYTFHIVKDKYFVVSAGEVFLTVEATDSSYIWGLFFIATFFILLIYSIFKLMAKRCDLLYTKNKIDKMKDHSYESEITTCTVVG